MKVVINSDFGGFGLSDDAIREYGKRKNLNFVEVNDEYKFTHFYVGGEVKDDNYFSDREIDRSDPVLVEIVESMGEKASGRFATLKIVQIPDDIEWFVDEYDGMEHVAERHRTWR